MRQCCAICGSVFETGTISSNVCPHCSIHRHTVKSPESNLATWKSRAEKAESEVKEWQEELRKSAVATTLVSKERDNLKSLCEKQKPYLSHKMSCALYGNLSMDKCTCGLDELLKQGEKTK